MGLTYLKSLHNYALYVLQMQRDYDDDDDNKPVWPLGLWAPASAG